MANPEHLKILKQGVKVFNEWREENPDIDPVLQEANLRRADLSGANLRRADLSGANLRSADLFDADLTRAKLSDTNLIDASFMGAKLLMADLSFADLSQAFFINADLTRADLTEAELYRTDLSGANLYMADLSWASLVDADLFNANLTKAKLTEAELPEANLFRATLTEADLVSADLTDSDLRKASLFGADLTKANLTRADLRETVFTKANLSETFLESANLVETGLEGANISNSRVYGISAWNLKISPETQQSNLIITRSNEPNIVVDDLEVAQFIYLLLSNEKIRDIVNTIGEKGVLILGRFTEERKAVLDAIRGKLRGLGFVPMMFDFEKPTQRDFTETIKTLTGLSRFIIADITNPRSSPLELQAIMPDYMIPCVPIIQEDEEPFTMFQDLQQKYGEWVLKVLSYDTVENLLNVMDEAVIKPALEKADQLLLKKTEEIMGRHVKDYLKE